SPATTWSPSTASVMPAGPSPCARAPDLHRRGPRRRVGRARCPTPRPARRGAGRVRCVSSSIPRTDDVDTIDDADPASAPGGALVDDSRRVLVHLLQGPLIDGRRDSARYGQLLRD